jgi:pimeloyl-ACP methyl ester carboxylesterase
MTIGQVLLLILAFVVVANISLEFIAPRVYPPIGKFLNIDGVKVHYTEKGRDDASALVMLHGNGTFLQDLILSGLVDAAASKFHVICFDRPGFGHSSRPRTIMWGPERQAQLCCDALQRLGIEHAFVLGHSWGSLVALAMATRKPDMVNGLVLVSGYYFPTWRFDVMMSSTLAIPLLGDIFRYTVSPLWSWLALPAFAKKVFAPNAIPEIVKQRYPRLLLVRPGQLRAIAEDSVFMVPAAAKLSLSYGCIRCPTAIIAGLNDEIVEREQAQRLKQALPNATVTYVPNVGHMLHYFVSREILQATDGLLLEDRRPLMPN